MTTNTVSDVQSTHQNRTGTRSFTIKHQFVTTMMNGGKVSQKDMRLSLEKGRLVIGLGGTGRLAYELAGELHKDDLITTALANSEQRVNDAVRAALSIKKRRAPARS